MNSGYQFDVIVVGAGHAGVEAAYSCAKMGSKTALISLTLSKIGYMPCNPQSAESAKATLFLKISALGGLMPQLCTKTYHTSSYAEH
jgi:tRNA uridine 5-carboxymethylaminomethyl modification enzyme